MNDDTIRASFVSQYASSLGMLQNAIRACPDDLWLDASAGNRFWHVTYHTLFYTDLYLSESEETYVRWAQARDRYQYLGPLPSEPRITPVVDLPYPRLELDEYAQAIVARTGEALARFDLDAPSGFDWVPLTKFEHQVYNIRHIQHHTGQLIDRLRRRDVHVDWIGRS